jgi:DNA-binding transcriptional MerR regulator
MNYSIGKISKRFGISRSTLLYYSNIGLLEPSFRNSAGYRFYCEDDFKKLEKILIYREAGVSLEDIKELLDTGEDSLVSSLLKRLGDINSEISSLKMKQQIIIKIMESTKFIKDFDFEKIDINLWFDVLEKAGIGEKGTDRWHMEFEKQSPEQHRIFLSLLGMDGEQIEKERKRYRKLIDQGKI